MKTYRGDGRFMDSCGSESWTLWDHDRYLLDLGRLDLTKPGEYAFRIGALPKAESWLIGLSVEPLASRPAEAYLDEAVLEVVMTNRQGDLVISESVPIKRWTWSLGGGSRQGVGSSLVYLVGRSREVPTGRGGLGSELVDVKAEGGWGTFFDPARNSGYELTVRVLVPDEDAGHFNVLLVAKGTNFGGSL